MYRCLMIPKVVIAGKNGFYNGVIAVLKTFSVYFLLLKPNFYLWGMSAEKIIGDWKKNSFRNIYWLEGEEDYYIDLLMDYAEHRILDESQAGFNLTVFYGKDAEWAAVVNACRR